MNSIREKGTARVLRAVAQELTSKVTTCSFFALLLLGAAGLSGLKAADDATLPPPAKGTIEYSEIEPIFKSKCYACHGPSQQKSDLRLDLEKDALQGGYSGPVIVPGKSADSKLIRLVGGVERPIMPVGGSRLTPEEVGLLRAWIDQGAKWPKTQALETGSAKSAPSKSQHWAFQAITKPELPTVQDKKWVANPIDSFVLAKLEANGIAPVPEAGRPTLIRRLSLDLTGLPPSPQEVAAFISDTKPDAYERVVDRLLQSPHYGEKWGRHWLDLARYADSDGYRKDFFRPHAWRYREWVINSLNGDMPFDEFTIEQIAGDLLPNATVEQKVATGFQRNTLTNHESGIDNEEFRFNNVVDNTNTVGTVWLGLTVGCAQCHNHKFDPIPQKEYYQLSAFFDNTEELDIDAPVPGEIGPYLQKVVDYKKKRQSLLEKYDVAALQRPWEEQLIKTADNPGKYLDWEDSLTELRSGESMPLFNQGEKILRMDPSKRTEKQSRMLTYFFLLNYGRVLTKEDRAKSKLNELRRELDALDAAFPALSQAQTITNESEPRKTYVKLRGNYRSNGAGVQPGTLGVLPPLPPSDSSPSRLMLAKWLVSRENPLTARVTANRLWQEIFGRGIVRSSDNFGTQGDKPADPALLDWLAADFMDSGWRWKHLIKTMVMSSTYRESSIASSELVARDPDNVFHARQSRLRLPAESIRDSALAVSGLLDTAVGGKSVRPPQPAGGYKQYGSTWVESSGPDRYRRGLYIQYQRIAPYPMLANFDMPSSYAPACLRNRSNSPLQALNLLNDPVFYEAAQALASRILTEGPAGFSAQLDFAFRLTVARNPDPLEKDWLTSSFNRQKQILLKSQVPTLPIATVLEIDPVEAAAWVGISSVLLNLDEFITKE